MEHNATVHLDSNEIDEAIEKVNLLLTILKKVRKESGSHRTIT